MIIKFDHNDSSNNLARKIWQELYNIFVANKGNTKNLSKLLIDYDLIKIQSKNKEDFFWFCDFQTSQTWISNAPHDLWSDYEVRFCDNKDVSIKQYVPSRYID